jgi:heat shock protein HslJ
MPATLLTGFVMLSGIIALSASTPVPNGESRIPPVIWELTTLSMAGEPAVEIDDPSRYTLQFLPDGTVTVRADCNQGTGVFSVGEGGTIGIDSLASTLMLCPDDSRDADFQAMLISATHTAFDDDGALVLSGDDGHLTLRPALSGVVWEWQAFRGGDDSVIRPEHPEQYTLEFLPDGKLAIRADCSRGTGSYTVDDARLDLRVGGVTRAMCPRGSLMDQFLRDLDQFSSYVVKGGHLYLALPVDAGIAEFAPRAIESPAATPPPP